MFFIGDTHGNHKAYMEILKAFEGESTFHVGDVGLGFPDYCDEAFLPGVKHKFIRGNHDNPAVCRTYSNYLGDWGFKDGIFFVGGGESIDRNMRTPMKDWWPDEQLSYAEFQRVLGNYAKIKPRVVVSHCAPTRAVRAVMGGEFRDSNRSMTEEAFDQMMDIHKPAEWIFGHYHRRLTRVVDGTKFQCLDMLRPQSIASGTMFYEIKGVEWS